MDSCKLAGVKPGVQVGVVACGKGCIDGAEVLDPRVEGLLEASWLLTRCGSKAEKIIDANDFITPCAGPFWELHSYSHEPPNSPHLQKRRGDAGR